MTIEIAPCECPKPEDGTRFHCPRYNDPGMTLRTWEICSGDCQFKPCRGRIRYIKKWLGLDPKADVQIPRTRTGSTKVETRRSSAVLIEEGPSWFRRLINYSEAVVKHVWHGMPLSLPETIQQRLAVCMVCPYLDPKNGRCRHKDCGCAVVKKATWAMERCPEGRW